MKGEDLFLALGKISDDLIEKAAPKKSPIYKKTSFKWVTAIAACLCVVIMGIAFNSTKDTTLPHITDSGLHFSDMGYEGTDELSLKETDDINPWNENLTIKALPVYKNLCYNSGALSQGYFTEKDLKNQVEDFCKALKLTYEPKEKEEGNIDGAYNFTLNTNAGTVTTNGKGCNLIIENGDDSLVKSHMKLLFGEENNKKIVSGDYYTYSLDSELLDKTTRSYLKGKDIVEDIVNFNFSSHYLQQIDSEIISRGESTLNGSEYLGEYPIKSLEKAKESLLLGKYSSSAYLEQVKGGALTEAVIAKVDLIYYTDGNPEHYLPYYRFYVKCTMGENIESYAYFYVCAIEDEYITFSVFDGEYQ